MTDLQKENNYEIKKEMLKALYKNKLITFYEYMDSLVSLMDEYDKPRAL